MGIISVRHHKNKTKQNILADIMFETECFPSKSRNKARKYILIILLNTEFEIVCSEITQEKDMK
jgi:hypothetical protein